MIYFMSLLVSLFHLEMSMRVSVMNPNGNQFPYISGSLRSPKSGLITYILIVVCRFLRHVHPQGQFNHTSRLYLDMLFMDGGKKLAKRKELGNNSDARKYLNLCTILPAGQPTAADEYSGKTNWSSQQLYNYRRKTNIGSAVWLELFENLS